LNRRIAVRARYGFAADLLELERAVEVGWRDVALLDHNSEFQR
jgi:hypothetical protein